MARPHELLIKLTKKEKEYLEKHCKSGNWSPRKVVRARVLLLADIGKYAKNSPLKDEDIATNAGCSKSSVGNLRKLFQSERLGTLNEKPRSGRPRTIDGQIEAKMISIACSSPPKGRERWTVRLIAGKLVELVEEVESISYSAVGKTLKKTNLNPGSKKSGK